VSIIPHSAENQKISDMQRAHSGYIEKLTANEKAKLGIYSSGNGAYINREIYKFGKDWEKSSFAPIIKTLDGIIGNAPRLAEDMVFFKGDSAEHWETVKAGNIKSIDGFFSTAVQKSIAERYATEKQHSGVSPIMVEVSAPAGTKGLYIGEKTAYPKGNEFEYLFPRGSRFRVLEKDDSRVLTEALNDS